jgi:8-oxo-dGTP diphosphatase
MQRCIAVRAIIVKDGKLLCVRAKPYRDHVRTDIWFTPGGGLDEGESLADGLRREILEEIGIEPVIGNLLYIQQFKDERKEHLEFFFHVTNADEFLNADTSATSHGKDEIEELEFIPAAKHDVFPTFLRKEDFSLITEQPVKLFNSL